MEKLVFAKSEKIKFTHYMVYFLVTSTSGDIIEYYTGKDSDVLSGLGNSFNTRRKT